MLDRSNDESRDRAPSSEGTLPTKLPPFRLRVLRQPRLPISVTRTKGPNFSNPERSGGTVRDDTLPPEHLTPLKPGSAQGSAGRVSQVQPAEISWSWADADRVSKKVHRAAPSSERVPVQGAGVGPGERLSSRRCSCSPSSDASSRIGSCCLSLSSSSSASSSASSAPSASRASACGCCARAMAQRRRIRKKKDEKTRIISCCRFEVAGLVYRVEITSVPSVCGTTDFPGFLQVLF